MQKIVILSHIINGRTPLYGGERAVVLKRIKSIESGDSCNTTHCSFSTHTGTHIDAPRHFIKKGKTITDMLPKELFFRTVSLIKVEKAGPGYVITTKDFDDIENCELILIKTDFEKTRGRAVYWKNSPALDPNLALGLKKACPSLRAVGIDFISISNLNNREFGRRAHKAFLEKGIFLIEDMKLADAKRAPSTVIVAPLLLDSAEAAPCTVLGIYN